MHMCMHMMCMHMCMCMCRRSVVERREAEGGQTELVGFEMAVDINPLCCPPMRSHTEGHTYIYSLEYFTLRAVARYSWE